MENEEKEEFETEIIDGILTFDELLEDEYYKSEFEKRVQQRLNIEKSHSDVKGGTEAMDGIVQNPEGETKQRQAEKNPEESRVTPAAASTENPAVETTETAKETAADEQTEQPAKEMTAKQFEQYNETLRRVSKTAKAGLPMRYNAFEDAEAKARVKAQIMAGETPSVKDLAAEIVARLTPKSKPDTEAKPMTDEMLALKAENALLKAGIASERVEAATRLFIAEGGDLGKVAEFAAKYPEWHKKETGVEFSKAPPVAGRTAPNPESRHMLNDFEKRVAAARKKAGLDPQFQLTRRRSFGRSAPSGAHTTGEVTALQTAKVIITALITSLFSASLVLEIISEPTFATVCACLIKIVMLLLFSAFGLVNGYQLTSVREPEEMDEKANEQERFIKWCEKGGQKPNLSTEGENPPVQAVPSPHESG